VRCPWHHACFDLRTGEAVGAPALNPIICYDVRREAGLVTVGKRRETPLARVPARIPSAVVIIGAGPAGAACAEHLRHEGYAGPVTLVGEEGPVDRPNLSKDFLAGTAPEEWLPLRGPEFYAEQKIAFLLGDPAVALDTRARTVTLGSGRSLSWGALVLIAAAVRNSAFTKPFGKVTCHSIAFGVCKKTFKGRESRKLVRLTVKSLDHKNSGTQTTWSSLTLSKMKSPCSDQVWRGPNTDKPCFRSGAPSLCIRLSCPASQRNKDCSQ